MTTATVLSVFALLLISYVQQTKAKPDLQICFVDLGPIKVDEDAGAVIVPLDKNGDLFANDTVSYSIEDLTTNVEDILGNRTGSVTFPSGVARANITVVINDDALSEDEEIFMISLNGPSACAGAATLAILDNDFYSTWTEWAAGECSVTCGPGNRTDTRTRNCTASNQTNCVEPVNETRNVPCNPGACPVIGAWSAWADSGECSVTCGDGTKTQARTRECTDICTPCGCAKDEERTVICHCRPCPSTWNRWSGSGRPNGNKRRRGWKRKRQSRRKRRWTWERRWVQKGRHGYQYRAYRRG